MDEQELTIRRLRQSIEDAKILKRELRKRIVELSKIIKKPDGTRSKDRNPERAAS
jgi:hypothetical protein